jgi:hypothetical protein
VKTLAILLAVLGGSGALSGAAAADGKAAAPGQVSVQVKEGPAYVAPKAPIHVVSDLEGLVYAAFLEQAFGPGKNDGPLARQTLLVENDSVDSWQPNRRAWERYLLKRVSGQGRAAEEVHAAFLARPQQVIRFYGFPAVSVSVRLLRSDILKAAFENRGWDAFYDRYPGVQGVLSLSAVAFNVAGTEALFAARLQCGKRCGYRDLVLMRKVNNAWTMIMKDALP